MVFALIFIWLYFQWMTVSTIYPYGLFLHPVNLANLLKQMAVTGVLARRDRSGAPRSPAAFRPWQRS
jgi:ABC-type xylose transport system permease subunit